MMFYIGTHLKSEIKSFSSSSTCAVLDPGGGARGASPPPLKFRLSMFDPILYQNASKLGSDSMREHLTP